MVDKVTPEHQNNMNNKLYNEPISKDPKGPEGPQATIEALNNACKILESENKDVFEIGEHIVHIDIK